MRCPLLVKCASVALAPKVAVVSPGRFISLAHGVLDLACLTEGRRRFAPPRSYPRNIRPRLSSPGRCASILRGNQESRSLAALYCVPAPAGCGSIASGLSPAIEAAVGAARKTEKDTTMATIGTFTSNGNGLGCVLGSVL